MSVGMCECVYRLVSARVYLWVWVCCVCTCVHVKDSYKHGTENTTTLVTESLANNINLTLENNYNSWQTFSKKHKSLYNTDNTYICKYTDKYFSLKGRKQRSFTRFNVQRLHITVLLIKPARVAFLETWEPIIITAQSPLPWLRYVKSFLKKLQLEPK